MQKYYQILEISFGATHAQIKTAFRKLAHKYHPDKAGGNSDKFKEISFAYHELMKQAPILEQPADNVYDYSFNADTSGGFTVHFRYQGRQWNFTSNGDISF